MFRHVKKIHFIGIGGIGMSGIAEVLCNLGFSGFRFGFEKIEEHRPAGNSSARRFTKDTRRKMSATRRSSFIRRRSKKTIRKSSSPSEKGIPVIPRAEMLAELMTLEAVCGRDCRHARQNVDDFDGRDDSRTRRSRPDDGCRRRGRYARLECASSGRAIGS